MSLATDPGTPPANSLGGRLVAGGLCAVLFVTLLATHIVTPGVLDTLAVLVVMAVVCAVYAFRRATLPVPVCWGWALGALCALLVAQIVLGQFVTWKLALAPFAAIVVIAVAAFVLPRVVSFWTFARVAALVPAVGMTALQGGVPEQPFGEWSALTAGLLGVVGCIGTLSLFDRERNPFDLALSMLAGWSVLILLQRAAIVVLVVGLVCYALATRVSYRAASVAVAAGALALVGFVVFVIAAPRPWVTPLPLTQRQWLWRGTWGAITDSAVAFLSGVGYVSAKHYLEAFVPHWMGNLHGPHNGYLLVWLRAGLVAAALHAALIWGTIAIALWRHARPAVAAATVALAVDMTVANFSLMTLSVRGVLLAALLGYLLKESAEWHHVIGFDGLKERLVTQIPSSFRRTSRVLGNRSR